MNLKVIEHKLFDLCSNPLNPTGLTIIEKPTEEKSVENIIVCPITKFALIPKGNSYYAQQGGLSYPIIQNVPCLLPENAVITTHFDDIL